MATNAVDDIDALGRTGRYRLDRLGLRAVQLVLLEYKGCLIVIRDHLLVALMREDGDSLVSSQASLDHPGDQGVMLFQRCLSVTSAAAQEA